jgi:hypothetical protein
LGGSPKLARAACNAAGLFFFISFEERLTFVMHNCSCGVCSCRDDSLSANEADFRRSVKNIVTEKFDGDIYAYIKSLYDTIDAINACMDNHAVDFLSEMPAA